ncbi:MAG: hypothetical protein IJU50_04475, partial [Lachnospiraceae bacterium]|nr:hypothetical protein [Lachnospiraceae bacterium]
NKQTFFLIRGSVETFPLPQVVLNPATATDLTEVTWSFGKKGVLELDSTSGMIKLAAGSSQKGKVKVQAKCGSKTAYFYIQIQ